VSGEARPRRTQKERRDETRRAALDAAVSALVELGHARTTTLEVQRRAGLSRGALLHHFPSKAELLAATVGHLAHLRGKELRDNAARLPDTEHPRDRIDAVIDLLWDSFDGKLFAVAMELRIAARTDPELRAVLVDVELRLREAIIAQCGELFGPLLSSRPGYESAMDVTLQLMIGAAMSSLIHDDPARVASLLRFWKQMFSELLERPIANCG